MDKLYTRLNELNEWQRHIITVFSKKGFSEIREVILMELDDATDVVQNWISKDAPSDFDMTYSPNARSFILQIRADSNPFSEVLAQCTVQPNLDNTFSISKIRNHSKNRTYTELSLTVDGKAKKHNYFFTLAEDEPFIDLSNV